jgi:hypothetical protein
LRYATTAMCVTGLLCESLQLFIKSGPRGRPLSIYYCSTWQMDAVLPLQPWRYRQVRGQSIAFQGFPGSYVLHRERKKKGNSTKSHHGYCFSRAPMFAQRSDGRSSLLLDKLTPNSRTVRSPLHNHMIHLMSPRLRRICPTVS